MFVSFILAQIFVSINNFVKFVAKTTVCKMDRQLFGIDSKYMKSNLCNKPLIVLFTTIQVKKLKLNQN